MTGKLIIFSAPSGSGKSTIINYLLTQNLNLAFSISATSRPPRGTEQHGVEYFFLTPEEFRCRIENNEFLEYEEVYKDRYYGTLKAQVEKQLEAGQNVVFDVDVVGGCNIKKFYGDRALSVFIQPPSVEELRCRLEGRGTDAPEIIESRIAKAESFLIHIQKCIRIYLLQLFLRRITDIHFIILCHITPLRFSVKPSDDIRCFQYEFLSFQLNCSVFSTFYQAVCHSLYSKISLHATSFTKRLCRFVKNDSSLGLLLLSNHRQRQ